MFDKMKQKLMNHYKEQSFDCDILVAGGGMSGVCCAIAAARCGVSVILCHDRSVLGGNASSEVRMHVMGADAGGERGFELVTEAREGGIIEEIRLENCVRNPQRSASMFDLILYEKCRKEKNLKLLLNTTVADCVVSNKNIEKVFAFRHSTEDKFAINSKIFIDCTGDGALGISAGAMFMEGREAKSEFNEKSAMETADNSRLGSTLLLQARKCNISMPFTAPSWVRKFTEQDLKLRSHNELEYGFWWVEWGGTLDTVKDNEAIRDELLAIMLGVWDHIKNGANHNAENWALEWFGFLPGKRESRRFTGQHVITQSDIMSSQLFDDAVAYGGWPIDLHPVEGIDVIDSCACAQEEVPFLYDIPLRACVSTNISNLMFAGRNISATHVAFASTRVMATCAAIGQGVGISAGVAVKNGLKPNRIAENRKIMAEIKQMILREDAYLIGNLNEDQSDLAKIANISASSEKSDGMAINIISGQTRAVHGADGVPYSRAYPGTHRWMSDPSSRLPQWIELRWNKSFKIGQVELIFDTGLHRLLTLCHVDSVQKKMLWGKPQPETISDYSIEYKTNERWETFVNIIGNYQRRRIHKLNSVLLVDAVRIKVTKTNGLDHARILEVRVY